MSTEPNEIFPGKFKVQWSETMHMLDLCADQIDSTIQESNDSMELLMTTFSALTSHLESLTDKIDGEKTKESIEATKEDINKAVIGLQFYDRMTQRLNRIREGLAVLAALIDDPSRQNIPQEWVDLHDKIKSGFSTEQQKTIFHALMHGADIDEVFELFEKE